MDEKALEIKTYKVKQYNAPIKTVVMVNGIPICICGSGKTLSKILCYLNGFDEDIKDGKIKKIIDEIKKGSQDE